MSETTFGTGATNSSNEWLSWLRSRLQQGIGTHVVTLNAEMTMQAECDATLAKVIDQELVIPDGAGVVSTYVSRVNIYSDIQALKQNHCCIQANRENLFSVFLAHGVAQSALKMATASTRIKYSRHSAWLPRLNRNRKLRQTLTQLQPQLILLV